jgi:hypothetical protein
MMTRALFFFPFGGDGSDSGCLMTCSLSIISPLFTLLLYLSFLTIVLE